MGVEKLKPCPVCGGVAKMGHRHDEDMIRWTFVQCQGCGLQTRGKWATEECPQFYQEARDEWNARTPAISPELAERLRAYFQRESDLGEAYEAADSLLRDLAAELGVSLT